MKPRLHVFTTSFLGSSLRWPLVVASQNACATVPRTLFSSGVALFRIELFKTDVREGKFEPPRKSFSTEIWKSLKLPQRRNGFVLHSKSTAALSQRCTLIKASQVEKKHNRQQTTNGCVQQPATGSVIRPAAIARRRFNRQILHSIEPL